MLKVGDVCVDIFHNICLVVGTPILMSQCYSVTFNGVSMIPMKADWDYLYKIGEL